MTRCATGRSTALALGVVALVWFLTTGLWTPAGAQETRDCADFTTQEEAQRFYDENEDDDPNDPDPFELDTDGDGVACEGLPTAGGAATASPGASPTATPSGQALPQNGAATGIIALSGLSLLEAGYGLTLASKRLGVRRRAVPLYLMRKMIAAASSGQDRVEVAEDVYLVHRSVLESVTSREGAAIDDDDEVEMYDPGYDSPEVEAVVNESHAPVNDAKVRLNVYAAIPRPHALPKHDD